MKLVIVFNGEDGKVIAKSATGDLYVGRPEADEDEGRGYTLKFEPIESYTLEVDSSGTQTLATTR